MYWAKKHSKYDAWAGRNQNLLTNLFGVKYILQLRMNVQPLNQSKLSNQHRSIGEMSNILWPGATPIGEAMWKNAFVKRLWVSFFWKDRTPRNLLRATQKRSEKEISMTPQIPHVNWISITVFKIRKFLTNARQKEKPLKRLKKGWTCFNFSFAAETYRSLPISVNNLLCLDDRGAIPSSRKARLPIQKTGL